MDKEYLPAGFTNVDQALNKDAYFDCLTLLDSLPYYKERKSKSYDLLDLKPGLAVLEAGCGLGDDALRIAERIIPGGRVFGLDASAAMIAKARQNARARQLPVEFLVGDVKALPFPDGAVSRCRIDRVLQYIPRPLQAVTELVRVLEPGGSLLAYDNDWDTFSIRSSDIDTARIIERLWSNSFANKEIGRDLQSYFLAAGLNAVYVDYCQSVITDFATADRIYNLQETVQRAVSGGHISAVQGHLWIRDLMSESARGKFCVVLGAYTVVGKKIPGQ
ncbi:MAG: methyltransferase domain-containing protein [Deltaproteobacteria bacterium]|nr:methyltransferase domain-containing protein [Deltaproteobacteria bacterium]